MFRVFASLFFATATAQLGLGIISPILPLYAKTFAASATQIGLVFTAFSISRALLGPFVGRLSDRIGRRPLILGGLLIYAVVSVLYASATSLLTLGAFRLLQGVASVMVTPIAQAYVGDLTPKGREGRYLNAFYSSQFIGMAFGPLLGGIIGGMWSYAAAFYVMGGLSVLSLVLVYLTVPVDQTARERRQVKPKSITPLREVVGNDAVKAMLAYFITRGFWRQSFNAFYPLYAVVAFSSGEANVGLVLSSYMFAEGLLQIPFGFLADRYPRIRQIVIGSVFAPLILLAVPFVNSPWAVAVLTFVMGAFSALGRSSLVAIRTELGRTHGMATLAGIQGSAFAVGQALGPLLTGLIVDAVGLLAVFPFGSAVGCVGTVLVLSWLTRWKRTNPDAAAMSRARTSR
ncbi:MFS transporter [Candidatus Bipolaricaulota bacterium]|nr:MFS transporter [Candidatus Bipolaricaulota bacterium]